MKLYIYFNDASERTKKTKVRTERNFLVFPDNFFYNRLGVMGVVLEDLSSRFQGFSPMNHVITAYIKNDFSSSLGEITESRS